MNLNRLKARKRLIHLCRPLMLLCLSLLISTTLLAAIISDTSFYLHPFTWSKLLQTPVFTPLNSLLYNTSTSSLSAHGLHPRYQHFLINFPLLLLPALPLLILRPPRFTTNARYTSAISATVILSMIPHQEPRFLIPIVPLLLSCIHLPNPSISPRMLRIFMGTWIAFNTILGLIYGRYHQAGVIPAQLWLGEKRASLGLQGGTQVFWWKTYSPPVWLLDTPRSILNTTDLMGANAQEVEQRIRAALGSCEGQNDRSKEVLLVVPHSRDEPTIWRGEVPDRASISRVANAEWTLLWNNRRHIGLDDIDFGEDGFWGTLRKLIGRRGLGIWRIKRDCG